MWAMCPIGRRVREEGGRTCRSLHRTTAFAPSRAARAQHACGLRPSETLDGLRCAVMETVPGNSARATGAKPCRNFPPLFMPRCRCVTPSERQSRAERCGQGTDPAAAGRAGLGRDPHAGPHHRRRGADIGVGRARLALTLAGLRPLFLRPAWPHHRRASLP